MVRIHEVLFLGDEKPLTTGGEELPCITMYIARVVVYHTPGGYHPGEDTVAVAKTSDS